MEQNDRDQKLLQNADKFNRKYKKFLGRTLQSVISVSLFSLFLCYSSGFCFFRPHSFIVYFSAFLFSLFTHTLQRRYIFLICNAILAILAKSLFSSSSSPSVTDIGGRDFSASDVFATKTSVAEEVQVGSIGFVDNHVALVAEGGGEEEEEENLADQAEKLQVQEDGSSSGAENEQREIEAFIADHQDEAGREEGEEEEEEVPPEANDELNKKFEEFIRKMKEEIRIEAQRQLIAV
ncbi:hypothetical protein F2P56_006823 [Juglans regia]|uniref:Uncharacterized protein LOC109015697 n=2 Tax=Juglans regia TaxID=51240 RepID=A0A2I4HC31_JUGRE|nr:uncharacterized protein LOC109015697 [Juglans regia]KAF5474971.1 hypothetical protein F2P56_006823 [Juglans regia]